MAPRRRNTTDDTVKVVRGFFASHKVILAVAAVIAVLYGGVRFVVDVSIDRALDRYERERQKIGRPEYKTHKEKTEQALEKLHDKLEKLDDRVDRIEARP